MYKASVREGTGQVDRRKPMLNPSKDGVKVKDGAQSSVAGRSVKKEIVNILMIGSHGSVYNCAAPYICGNSYQSLDNEYWEGGQPPKFFAGFDSEKSKDGCLHVEILECDFRNQFLENDDGLDEVSANSLDVSKYQDIDHICLVSEFQNYQAETSATVRNIKELIQRIDSSAKNDKLKLSFMYVGLDAYGSERDSFSSLKSAHDRRHVAHVGVTSSIVANYMPDASKPIYQLIGPLSHQDENQSTAKDAQKEAEEFFRGTRDLIPVNGASGESTVSTPSRPPKRKLEEDSASARKLARTEDTKTNEEESEEKSCIVM